MAKPIIYFQGSNSGAIPSNRTSFRWTEETELGSVLSCSNGTVGINLGSLTNNQSSSVYDIIISHDAIEPITNVKFYFGLATTDRSGQTGFTSTADQLGIQADYEELKKWGTDSFNNAINAGPADGLHLLFKNETASNLTTQFRDGFMDELATAKPLTDDGKGATGGSPDSILPFNNFAGPDYAWLKLHIHIPESVVDAGKRQCALISRITYSY